MRLWILLLPALLGVALQDTQPAEKYPGQASHAVPPDGWYCLNQNYTLTVPADHVCSCERMKREDGTVVEDSKCSVFCHADHCKCLMSDMTKQLPAPDATPGDPRNPFDPDF